MLGMQYSSPNLPERLRTVGLRPTRQRERTTLRADDSLRNGEGEILAERIADREHPFTDARSFTVAATKLDRPLLVSNVTCTITNMKVERKHRGADSLLSALRQTRVSGFDQC